MALSVGKINLEYDHNPPPPARDFFADLVDAPDIGDGLPGDFDIDVDDDDDDGEGVGYWCGTMDDVGILSLNQYGLTERAETWCRDRGISDAAREGLLNWIANLPWKYGVVRLHLVF